MGMEHWQWYGVKGLQVCPYMPGSPVWKDGVLSHLYYKMRDENKLIDLFCGDELNHDGFVSFFDRLKALQVLARVTEGDKLVPIGFSWANYPKGKDGCRSSEVGFAFFDGASKTQDARALAKLALAYAFEALRIDVIFGRQIAANVAARNFAMKIGFKEVALIPNMHVVNGEFADGRLVMIEKKDFFPAFLEWKKSQDAVS